MSFSAEDIAEMSTHQRAMVTQLRRDIHTRFTEKGFDGLANVAIEVVECIVRNNMIGARARLRALGDSGEDFLWQVKCHGLPDPTADQPTG